MANQVIVDSTMVNVLNYSSSKVSLPTHINPEGYIFEEAIDGEPTLIPMSFAEIRVTNGQSQIFKEGYLRFDEDIQEDIYKALKIRDWEEILSEEEIKDIILHPTKEKLEKIIKITSMSMFDRVRSILIRLDNIGTYDIPKRVADVINNRYQELYRGIRKSEIVINKSQQEVNDLIKENELAKIKAELERKIRAEIEAEMKANANNETNINTEPVKSTVKTKK